MKMNFLTPRRAWPGLMVWALLPLGSTHGEEDRAAPGATHITSIDGFDFQVAEGWELTKIAGADLVTRPTVCDWDDRGRLVVVSSAGASGSVEQQLESKPHRVVRLVDDDGDGVFDRSIVAAENLSFYSGVLCEGDDLYVSAPPKIWKLTDADGDGFCESRKVWHDGQTLTYCANDLHGPYRGPDGWIYWCKGAFGRQTHELTDGSTLVSKAAHILRKRPGGDRVEIITSGGMDNPIELAFLDTGERFFTSTFLQHPAGGRRDGIAHAVHGSVYGKDHHVIDHLPRTGDLMPVMTHLGPAAPTGLLRRRYGNLPNPLLVCGQFNLHRVTQHRVVPHGATYRTVDQTLVHCDRLDFHPTDVIEDIDGSLIFLDTGDWYDLCCPSSGAEGKRSPGGVYRLRQVDPAPADLKRDDDAARIESSMTAAAAVRQLADPRFQVRDRAADWLVNHADKSVVVIQDQIGSGNVDDAVATRLAWVLARIGGPSSVDGFDTLLLGDQYSAKVRHAALMAAMHCSELDRVRVRALLQTSLDMGVRRAAAQWLGLHGDRGSVPVIFSAMVNVDPQDRVMMHSLRYALIQLDRPAETVPYLSEDHAPIQRHTALMVIQQTSPEQLDPTQVSELLASTDASLRSLATRVMKEHEDWAGKLTQSMIEQWLGEASAPETRGSLIDVLSAWAELSAAMPAWEDLLARAKRSTEAIRLLTSVRRKSVPQSWDDPIANLIASSSADDRLRLADWLSQAELHASRHVAIRDALVQLARDESRSRGERLRFAAALPAAVPAETHGLSQLIVESLVDGDDSRHRELASRFVDRQPLDASAASWLLERLDEASIVKLPSVVAAIASGGERVSASLLSRMADLPLARTLPRDFVTNVFMKYPDLAERGEKLAEELTRPPANIAGKLNALQSELPRGDMVRGMRVFHGTKAACGKCHMIGDVGGTVGPELTKIGKSRSRTELLEAIVFPSSHIAQGYRSVRVLTVDGKVHQGIVKHESSEKLTLITGIDREATIPKAEIELRQDSDVSIMPAGLDGSLSKQELADVLELLKVRTSW